VLFRSFLVQQLKLKSILRTPSLTLAGSLFRRFAPYGSVEIVKLLLLSLDRCYIRIFCYSIYLAIVNCGYSSLKTVNIHYKRLRTDFYLLVMTRGTGTHILNGNRYNLKEGDMFLYFPNEPQEYIYKAKSNSTWYWVHFSGTKAIQFMQSLRLKSGPLYPNNTDKILRIYDKILNEYKIRDAFYEESATNYLRELLIATVRAQNQFSLKKEFLAVIEVMTSKPTVSNEECAKICHCSPVHFVRLFKKAYGITPHKYKQKIIVDRAKDLLTNTNKTVSSISEILGFEENPFYLNKLFKTLVGMTPIEYRKQNKPQDNN